MKKKIFKLLTGMLLSCALAGSTVAVQAEEAGTDTVKSYLTGEDVSVGIGHRRPIAVMLGNDTSLLLTIPFTFFILNVYNYFCLLHYNIIPVN